jgi:hypothetical protein
MTYQQNNFLLLETKLDIPTYYEESQILEQSEKQHKSENKASKNKKRGKYVRNKVSGGPFSRHLTLAPYLQVSMHIWNEEQLIRELKLSGVNHHRVKEWICEKKQISHADLPTTRAVTT